MNLDEVLKIAEKAAFYTVRQTGCIDGHAIVVGHCAHKNVMFDIVLDKDHESRVLSTRATGEAMKRIGVRQYSIAMGITFEDRSDGMIVGACDAHTALVNTYAVKGNRMHFLRREENIMTPLLVHFTTMLQEEKCA